jgi:type II secretory pathway pseudopilin PulG
MKEQASTLIELLCVIAITLALFTVLLPTLGRGYARSRAWVWGIGAYHANQLNAFLDEMGQEAYYTTNKPQPWSFIPAQGNALK